MNNGPNPKTKTGGKILDADSFLQGITPNQKKIERILGIRQIVIINGKVAGTRHSSH
jgi:hypothetical protein